ncbi:uncharacterized protein LOC144550011 [Carex rostrata]
MDSQSRPLLLLREQSINNGANQEESTMKACFSRVDILAKASIAAVGIIGAMAFSGYKDIKLPVDSLTSVAALVLILTLVSGFGLAKYVLCMSHHINLTNWQYMLHVVLVSCDGVSLMCTDVLLLALVKHVNALLACFLVVVPFVIGMLAYAGSQITGSEQQSRDQTFEAAMKSCSDVAFLTVGGAFSMQLAIIFEFYKNPSLMVNQLPPIDLSVTFLASVLGVFSMMVTAMPLELLPLAMRTRFLLLIKFLKNSMLILSAAAAITLGEKFIHGLVFLSLMPILVVKVSYLAVLLFTEEQVSQDSNNFTDEPEIPTMLTGVTTTCIVLLSAVYALYPGDEDIDVYLRIGILVLISIIVSSLSWIAFLLMPSMNEQWANVTKLVSGILLGVEIIIAAAFLLKIYIDLYNKK